MCLIVMYAYVIDSCEQFEALGYKILTCLSRYSPVLITSVTVRLKVTMYNNYRDKPKLNIFPDKISSTDHFYSYLHLWTGSGNSITTICS